MESAAPLAGARLQLKCGPLGINEESLEPDTSALSAALRVAIDTITGAFRPISLVEDGSAKLRPTGTSFVLASGSRRVFATAEHVVSGPGLKYVGLSSEGGIHWPRKYWRLKPIVADLPPVDIAWATTDLPPDADPDIAAALPLESARQEFRLDQESNLLAVGFPASRAKVKAAHTVVATQLMAVVGRAAPKHVYADLSLDHRVHLAMTYAQHGSVDAAGNEIVGAHPKGMSGGALFVITYGQPRSGPVFVIPFLAGVLTQFHEDDGIMVAARIECLLDGLGVPRASAPRYVRVDA